MVTLDHGFGITTKYGHLSRIVVKEGQQVKRGDLIGFVGSTGRSTGAHLHYEVWMNGRLTNPLTLLAR
jgi:murein DD-endopeptidase MepM/ murein hydrolase activator NlpD